MSNFVRLVGRKSILFVDPDESWILAFRIAKQLNFDVLIVQCQRFEQAFPRMKDYSDFFDIADTSESSALTKCIAEIIPKTQVACAITSRDACIFNVASVCETLYIPFTSKNAVGICRNKSITRGLLKLAGHDLPRYAGCSTLVEIFEAACCIGFPCVLKPNSGHLSILCFKLKNVADLSYAISKISSHLRDAQPEDAWITQNGFICEEWLTGPIVTVGVAGDGKERSILFTSLATTMADAPCVGFGTVIPWRDESNIAKICRDYALKICELLDLRRGVFDIEMIWHKGKPILVEANPRRSGGEMRRAFELATGRSYYTALILAYAGKHYRFKKDKGKVSLTRKVMLCERGSINLAIFEIWLRALPKNIQFINYKLNNNSLAEPLITLGRLVVVGTDKNTCLNLAENAISNLEILSGLVFCKDTLFDIKAF